MGLLLLGAISLLLGEKSIKWGTLYMLNNITNLGIFTRKKAGTLGWFLVDLHLLVVIFFIVSLKTRKISLKKLPIALIILLLVTITIIYIAWWQPYRRLNDS